MSELRNVHNKWRPGGCWVEMKKKITQMHKKCCIWNPMREKCTKLRENARIMQIEDLPHKKKQPKRQDVGKMQPPPPRNCQTQEPVRSPPGNCHAADLQEIIRLPVP